MRKWPGEGKARHTDTDTDTDTHTHTHTDTDTDTHTHTRARSHLVEAPQRVRDTIGRVDPQLLLLLLRLNSVLGRPFFGLQPRCPLGLRLNSRSLGFER